MAKAELWTVEGQERMKTGPDLVAHRIPTSDNLSIHRGSVKKGVAFGDHTHAYDQWVLMLKGLARFKCGDETYNVSKGAVLKIPAGVTHSVVYITDCEAIEFGLGREPEPKD